MRNSKFSMLSSIAAALSMGSMPGAESAFKPPRIRVSKRYPEQSSRQTMRGHRRAQGGPGLVLVGNKYEPNYPF